LIVSVIIGFSALCIGTKPIRDASSRQLHALPCFFVVDINQGRTDSMF
jgi:hypothetical protein